LRYAFIAIENLKLKNMTRSSRGTLTAPGKNVKQKADLNRSMLDASIGLFFPIPAYKAEEAGSLLEKVNPNGASQRCAMCHKTVHKTPAVRTHVCCHCGFVAHRDYNAALNILFLGLAQAGREPSEVWRGRIAAPVKHETASILLHGGR
jgi:putative transposase